MKSSTNVGLRELWILVVLYHATLLPVAGILWQVGWILLMMALKMEAVINKWVLLVLVVTAVVMVVVMVVVMMAVKYKWGLMALLVMARTELCK
jgi:hypothetical protein